MYVDSRFPSVSIDNIMIVIVTPSLCKFTLMNKQYNKNSLPCNFFSAIYIRVIRNFPSINIANSLVAATDLGIYTVFLSSEVSVAFLNTVLNSGLINPASSHLILTKRDASR